MGTELDVIFLMIQAMFTPGGFIVLCIIGLICLIYLGYNKYHNFQDYGQPDYVLAIGLPVAIVVIMVVFLLISKWGKNKN